MDNVSDVDLEYIIDHVFLPPKLPQKRDPDTHRKDFVLLEYVTRVSRAFAGLAIPQAKLLADQTAWRVIPRMLEMMGSLYSDGAIVQNSLRASLQKMEVHDVLPVFIEAQNAAIIFRKSAQKIFTFEAFEVSLPCEVVMKTTGKIGMRFPTNPRLPFTADEAVISTLANVLAHLSTNLMEEAVPLSKKGGEEHYEGRDTASPRFITEAIAGIIRAIPPDPHTDVQTTYIHKRLDDHVLWKSTLVPWRRSSIWLISRVAMQTTLEGWGVQGAHGYKVFQAFLLASLLNEATSRDPDVFKCDLLSTMNAKVARRLCKLGDVIEDPSILTLAAASDAVHRTAQTLKERWDKIQRLHETTVQWSPSSRDLSHREGCTDFSFPNSRDFLLALIKRHDSPAKFVDPFDRSCFEASLARSLPLRAQLSSSHLPTDILGNSPVEGYLRDFEVWVEVYLRDWERSPLRSERDCLGLSSAIDKYREMASPCYKEDPERFSLMHLCILELWVTLDKICVKWCPLLSRYKPEIAQGFAEPLILPYFGQMERLERAQVYLRSRYQEARKHGGRSIFREVNSTSSFQNQYFSESIAGPLLALERKIRDDAARRKSAKLSELHGCNEKYHTLIREASALECIPQSVGTTKSRKGRKHATECLKCSHKATADALKIAPFEDPLPQSRHLAQPIIFELNCPLPFAVWRDVTIEIILSVLGVERKSGPALYPLRAYSVLKEYFCEPYAGCRIGLASSTKSLNQSHYGAGCKIPASQSQVIFEHNGSFNLFDAGNRWINPAADNILRSACTFQLGGLYAPLHEFVKDTRHTPNSILTSLSHCPSEISSTEYTSFGLLRAGNRLQWRNIMRVIKSQTLSLSEPGSFILIVQSIWQAGQIEESAKGGTLYRQAHLDLLDENFGNQVAEELLKNVKSLGGNWKQAIFLATIIALAIRVLAFSPHSSVRLQIRHVLSEARILCMEWIQVLLHPQPLTSDGPSSTQGNNEREDYQLQALANVAVVLRASFDIEDEDYAKALRSRDDFIMYIYSAVLISTAHAYAFASGLKLLESRSHRAALKIAPHLMKACKQNPSILNDVATVAWPTFAAGCQWTAVPSCNNRWWTSCTVGNDSKTLYLNITDGAFLVDGKTFDHLPADYKGHPMYATLFNDYVFHTVQPSTIPGMLYQSYFGAHEIHFGKVGEKLVILRRIGADLQEYISTDSLEQDLPKVFSINHCFWYSRTTRTIQLRHWSRAWVDDDKDCWHVHLTAHLAVLPRRLSGRVEKKAASGNKRLVNPESPVHQVLARTLAPLEPDPRGLFATVFEHNTSKISIHLSRHDLSFCLRERELECVSLSGHLVDVNLAGTGCLFGLRSILNLRHSDPRQASRKIIVPKGTLELAPGKYGHASISIRVGESNGYFVYDVDDLTGRLVGTHTMESDLYLVKLHAFTASPSPDPLTRRTGTAEALDRLGSAASFSFYAVSEETRSYLAEIMELTPLRSFYPLHRRVMETVQWNDHLPALAQHPGFRSLGHEILSTWCDTENFLQMRPIEQKDGFDKGLGHLTFRSALRNWDNPTHANPKVLVTDHEYAGRDSLGDSPSRERESNVFQAASLTQLTSDGFKVCRNLRSAVSQWNRVEGIQQWRWDCVTDWLHVPNAMPIADTWCTLYNLCCNSRSSRFNATVALAFQAFRGVPLELIGSLAAVLNDPEFASNEYGCPQFSALKLSKGTIYDRGKMLQLVQMHKQSFKESAEYKITRLRSETEASRVRRAQGSYNVALQEECREAVEEFGRHWPAIPANVERTNLRLLKLTPNIIKENIWPWLNSWTQNRLFLAHIDTVQAKLNRMSTVTRRFPAITLHHPPLAVSGTKFRKPSLIQLMRDTEASHVDALMAHRLQALLKAPPRPEELNHLLPLLQRLEADVRSKLEREYLNNLHASLHAYQSHLSQVSGSYIDGLAVDSLDSSRSCNLEHSRAYFDQICWCLRPNTSATRLMQLAGIWPVITPNVLLQLLSLKSRDILPSTWRSQLVGYAISVHDAKQATRMHQLAVQGMLAPLQKELQYEREWNPLEYPDWLLVEIESNFSVRSEQAAIAHEMLKPDGGQNTIIQLNMGEGKSSVIVPIVAASASTGLNLARVIVPRAQMKQQFQILRQTITGLCNRRVAYLPFNRGLQLDAENVSRVNEFLRKGAVDGMVWVCEPEHLLSLKMLGLDKAMRAPEHACARNLVKLHAWLHGHTKDILDESDDILHTRQQVVYTIGSQQSLDSAPLRWEIVQKLLGLLASYLKQDHWCPDTSLFLIENARSKSAFPPTRIQSDAARQHLALFMAESIHSGDWPLPPHMNSLVVDFVTSTSPSETLKHRLRSYCTNEDIRVMQLVLMLRGLIGSDIILHSLKERRWRVQYGLDLRRSKLAVPFRAKDSPSPRSEFGHPDVLIVLTCLSYYYGGLDMEMVTHTLQALLSSEAPEPTYADWMKPCWEDVPFPLRKISGINLQDEELLRFQIFPLLQYNKSTIDFYLNAFVFPVHAKEFPSKISTSGWDIAATKPISTTGFSGTNDGRFLLPVTIHQTDRLAQLHTNAKVLSCVLKQENSSVVRYPNFIGSTALLDRIQKLPSRPTVILDVGAQILDLSNMDFARNWLAMYQDHSTIKAAVFFDEWNNLLVLIEDGTTQPLIDSPYSNRLDQCLVYLDEAHTRGTDLRIPNTVAVVTLGPKLNKDKLVQGCMRMRKLGEGHTLIFMASEEVVRLVQKATNSAADTITTEDVILWSIKESLRELQANLPAWVNQGHSFVRREAAWDQLSPTKLPSPERVAELFCETDAHTLEDLYGEGSAHWIWKHHSGDSKNDTIKRIVWRCQDFDSVSIKRTGFHEEMEIELVHEKEVERQVQRPPSVRPAQHSVHPNVKTFVATGKDVSFCRAHAGFRTAHAAFNGTSLPVPADLNKVFSNIMVTDDFWRTIVLPSTPPIVNMDWFLRAVEWVVTVGTEPATQLMVLFSPYEVNELLPIFRTSTKVKLHMFTPRSSFSAPSLEDLNFLALPSNGSMPPLPRPLALQLNLFSGSLYFRDYQTYVDVCRVLRLHFGPLREHLAKPDIINANFFVLNPQARRELGMSDAGFNVNALPFFRNMARMRRFGRGLGPSHLGKILNGTRLKEDDFAGNPEVKGDEDVHVAEG